VTPQDFPELPSTLLGAPLFRIEETEEPFSPFQQREEQRKQESIQLRIQELERIEGRLQERIALNRRIIGRADGRLNENERLESHTEEHSVRDSQTPQIPHEKAHVFPLHPLENDEFFDACEVIDRKSNSARRWLLHKKYSHFQPLPLSPFSEDRKYRIMNNMDLPDPPGIWTKVKEMQGLTYYKDRWGIKRVYQPDQPESSPAKRQKSSTASPAIFSSPRPRGSSRKTYADRTRRRQIEANGRIDRTIFRLPELLAQQRADAAAKTARLPPTSDDTIPPMTPPSTTPAPIAATTPTNSSWPRTIFDSVTRRWTSLWGRTPSGGEAAEQPIGKSSAHEFLPNSSHHVSVQEPQTPQAQNIASDPPASAPSAYNDARSRQETSITVTRHQTGNPRARRRTNARPYYPSRNYDLYPRGFDEALLDRCFAGSTAPGQRKAPAPSKQKEAQARENGSETGDQPEVSNKRKRQPSPDVIPNPPGCSYGLHDDYFTYDDDDEAWAVEEQARRDAATTSTASEEPVTKKVKVNFNTAGHFEVPYSSDSDESTPVPHHIEPEPNHPGNFEVPASEPEKHTPTKSSDHTETGVDSKRSPSPLTKARRTAEQHKPKTPSRLRSTHRFSLDSVAMDNLDRMMTSENASERERAATVLQACPTGDLRHIKWPKTKTWVEKIDLLKDDVRARDRSYGRAKAMGGFDLDAENQRLNHEKFKENLAKLTKARRDRRHVQV
jgi:hypothetical protein